MSGISVGYEYVNARLRAMRSRLLRRPDLEQLLAAPTLEALIGQLDQGPYHDALQQSLVTSSGLDAILRAIQIGHDGALRHIAAFGGDVTAAVLAVLLAPYARHNVATLLRGTSIHSRPERTLPWLVAVPPFTAAHLMELARQPDLRSLVDLLAQWRLPTAELAAFLVAALSANPSLSELIATFDQAWAAGATQQATSLPREDGALLRLDLQRFLDLANLRLALNLRNTAPPTPVPWLPGGGLRPDALESIRGADDNATLRTVLQSTPAGQFWQPALDLWQDSQWTTLQHLWEETLLRWRTSLFARTDPLGAGPLIAYLAAKDAEARNLRLVAEAVAGNISHEDARALWQLAD